MKTQFIIINLILMLIATSTSFAQITGDEYSAEDLAHLDSRFIKATPEMDSVIKSFIDKEYIKPFAPDHKDHEIRASFLGLSYSLSLYKNSKNYPSFLLPYYADNKNPDDDSKIIYSHRFHITSSIDGFVGSSVTLYSLDQGESWFFQLDREHVPFEKETSLYLISSALTAHMLESQK